MPLVVVANSKLDITQDAFLGGRIMISQPKAGHRAGIDAVLLAASIGDGAGGAGQILDVGAGPGTVGLLVAQRLERARVTCVEIEAQLVELARLNSEDNDLSGRVNIVEADVCQPFRTLEALGLKANSFDQVISNPPFYDEDRCRTSDNDLKRRANSFEAGGLEKWIKFMTTVTRADGLLTIIYPCSRMDELLELIKGRFGMVEIFPIFPRAGEAAIRVIIRVRKGSRSPLKLYPGIVLHNGDGSFTGIAEDILSLGAALDFGGV